MSETREPALPASESGIDVGKEYRAERGLPVVPSFDGFRAAAIFAIVILHLFGFFANPESDLGRTLLYGPLPNALDALFIISGFVLFLPTVAKGGDFGSVFAFGLRRGARLFPGYWVAIGLILVMLAAWPASPAPAFPPLGDIGAHLAGLQVPVRFFDSSMLLGLGIAGPIWTISLEIAFYLVLPLIAAVYFRHPFIGLLLSVAITIGWKVGVDNLGEIVDFFGFAPSPERLAVSQRAAYGQFPGFAIDFGLGMTAAWLFMELPRRFRAELLARRALWFQLGSAAAFLALSLLFGRYAIDNTALAPTRARGDILLTLAIPTALTVFMLATALAPRRQQWPFSLSGARWLGDISFGVYLMHFPLILFYVAVVVNLPAGTATTLVEPWIGMPIVLALSTLYGYLSGRFIEMPARRWAHRYGYRARAAAKGARAGSAG